MFIEVEKVKRRRIIPEVCMITSRDKQSAHTSLPDTELVGIDKAGVPQCLRTQLFSAACQSNFRRPAGSSWSPYTQYSIEHNSTYHQTE